MRVNMMTLELTLHLAGGVLGPSMQQSKCAVCAVVHYPPCCPVSRKLCELRGSTPGLGG
jgi:hypothetical protein